MELYKQKLNFYENSNNVYKINKYQNKIEQYGGGSYFHKNFLKSLNDYTPYHLLLTFNNDEYKFIKYKPEIYVLFSDKNNFEKYALRYVSLIMYLLIHFNSYENKYNLADEILSSNLFNDLFFNNLFVDINDNETSVTTSKLSIKIFFKSIMNKLTNIIYHIDKILSDKLIYTNYEFKELLNYNYHDNNILYFSNKNKISNIFSKNTITHIEDNFQTDKYIYLKINYLTLNNYLKNGDNENLNHDSSKNIIVPNKITLAIKLIETDDLIKKEFNDTKNINYVILKLPHKINYNIY